VELAAIVLVIAVALAFDYTNGFHDAANAIATSVSTRALAPRTALLMAAVMNLVDAFLASRRPEGLANSTRDVTLAGQRAASPGLPGRVGK
jgi:PiT family inorganic phosphate transporter